MVMMKLMLSAATAGMLIGIAAIPAPALAQAGQLTVTIYGNDPCPREYICVRKKESDRYRLPQSQNPQGTLQQRQSWSQKSQALETVGAVGTGSCSAVGPGGRTGCLVQEINQARKSTAEQAQQDQAPQ
jgi:hypothetical protein